MTLILIILVVLLCLGGLPQVTRHQYGYAPVGVGGILLLILLIMLLTGRLNL